MERDELKKHVLEVLRNADKPLMAKEIAAILREKFAGMDNVEKGWPKRKNVNSVLYEMQGKEVSKSEDYHWSLMQNG